MNLEPTAEQDLLASTLARLLDGVDAERLRSVWGRDLLAAEYRALAEMGLVELVAGAASPDEHRLLEVALIGEALGRRAAITPMMSASMAAGLLGDSSFTERIVAGEVWSLASCAPGARRFLAGAPAVVDDGGASVSGAAVHVDFAAQAAGFVVVVDGAVCAVDAGAPGVTVSDGEVIGGVPTGRVRFDGAPVVEHRPVSAGDLDSAWATALLLQAGYLVGAAGRLLDLTRDHVLERRQFGVPLGTFQVVKHHLADSKIGYDGARLLLLHTAWLGVVPLAERLALAAEAKAYAAEVANDVARWAHELHGGLSVVDEHEVSLLSRRVVAESTAYGSPRQLWSVAGRALAGSVVGIPA